MNILLKRTTKLPERTLGELYIGGVFFCYTLEDVDRGLTSAMSLDKIKSIKVHGKTAIPTGTYTVVLSYSPKFKKMLPLVLDVPGYLGIRIHSGNTEVDTDGCPLIGKLLLNNFIKPGTSRLALTEFMKIFVKAIKTEKVTLTVV